MRVYVYPRRVENDSMTQQKADHETESMQSVLDTLRMVKRMQSMPQRMIASGDVHGAGEWRDGLNEINDCLDSVIGQEQGELL